MSRPFDTVRVKADVAAAQTDAVVLAAVAGKRLRVLSVVIGGDTAATTVVFNSKPAGAGVAISQVYNVNANDFEDLGVNEYGWFETNVDEGLTVTTGAGGGVGLDVLIALV